MSRGRAAERFVRLSERVLRAPRERELVASRFALLVHLIAELDRDGEGTFTLAQLRDGCGWEMSEETLRRAVHELADARWICAETRGGARRWRITLADAKLLVEGEPPRDLQNVTASGVEVGPTPPPSQTSTRATTGVDASPGTDSVQRPSEPPQEVVAQPPCSRPSLSTSFSEENSSTDVGEEAGDSASEIPLSLTDDVAAAVERGRQLRRGYGWEPGSDR